MEAFIWDKHFETGLATVDQQHHNLVNIINRYGEQLTQADAVNFDEIEVIFGELASYAQYHFSEEEQLILKTGVAQQHYKEHKKLHDEFIQNVVSMHESVLKNNETPHKLLNLLTSWLAFHILGTDKSMARQIAAIQSGQKPNSAYIYEKETTGTATEPLVATLNNLFLQVSEQNRELIELNRTLEKKVAERTQSLYEANQLLEKIAMTDVLTNLPNRRHAMESLNQTWSASIRYNTPLSCMMIDADGFKQINDNYGHDAGDEVLIQLSQKLRAGVRGADIVCRLGGDEFLIICPNTSIDKVLIVAEKMREQVANLRVSVKGGEWIGSISVGVAERTLEINDIEKLMKAADNGVYLAKQNGRNRVEFNLAS